ncbi:ABC transporter substrate-binding protein [Halocatena halophila]|uniref:ABC transporter substrate-binding protein n=1 Tax=Halocatena halophila TaxID=2814576 RepID=UPI002ED1F12F
MTQKLTQNLQRRTYLEGLGLVGTAALTSLAGCTGGGDNSGNETLEILHGWSGGDGQIAFDSMLEGFKEKHPDIDVNAKAIGGGGNTSLDARINTRLNNQNPPGSWTEWPGKNLQQFTNADLLGDIGESVWSNNNMQSAYLDGPKQAATSNGTFVCIPTNIHRMNNLFYNTTVVEAAGVDPSKLNDPMALADAIRTISENTDAVGMAHSTKSPWTTLQLWATVFLGQAGIDAYEAFINGNGDKDAVASAFETLLAYSEQFPDDASTIGWKEANNMFVEGAAGFFHQGDWAAGAYGSDFAFGENWDHVAFPGTSGQYALNMDSWVIPQDGPASKAAKTWLQYVGTKDAQVRFNTKKGSVPPRADVSTGEFGPFQTAQIESLQDSTVQPPSIAHGLAVKPEILTKLKQAVRDFSFTDASVDKTAQAFMDAF